MGRERLLTVAEAAELVQRNRRTVSWWVGQGYLVAARREPRPYGSAVILLRAADVRAVAERMARRGKSVRAALAKVVPVRPSIKVPSAPTDARPGSEERIRVYEERVERGEALFHPGDVTHNRNGMGFPFGEAA